MPKGSPSYPFLLSPLTLSLSSSCKVTQQGYEFRLWGITELVLLSRCCWCKWWVEEWWLLQSVFKMFVCKLIDSLITGYKMLHCFSCPPPFNLQAFSSAFFRQHTEAVKKYSVKHCFSSVKLPHPWMGPTGGDVQYKTKVREWIIVGSFL